MDDQPERYEAMAQAMDQIVETLNVVRQRLLKEGFSPEAAERITVVIFAKVWGGQGG